MWRCRQIVACRRCECMEYARAVEPQLRAIARMIAVCSAYVAPPPPSSAGTGALKIFASRSAA